MSSFLHLESDGVEWLFSRWESRLIKWKGIALDSFYASVVLGCPAEASRDTPLFRIHMLFSPNDLTFLFLFLLQDKVLTSLLEHFT